MAQFNWLYLSERGRKYNVGLFHGDRTGHLMVLCNARIVLIDFSVRDPKDYSFFIDEELFELTIKGRPGQYAYNCIINEEADTPRNRIRKKRKRIDFQKTVALITTFALVIIGVLGFAMVSQKDPPPPDMNVLLSQRGQETEARIFLQEPQSSDQTTIKYSFITDGQVKEFRETLNTGVANGFPLEDGDEFKLRYVYGKAQANRLELDRPTKKQLEKYQERALQQHRALNPRLDHFQAKCSVEIAYRLGGVEALAIIYNQQTSKQDDPVYNELTYKKLIRDIPFQEAVEKECWD